MDQKVYIEKCEKYQYEDIERIIFKCLEAALVAKEDMKGKKVLVKVNLLQKRKPEEAVTTHPLVAEAVVNFFLSLGCDVTLGDSPGGPHRKAMLESVYKETGMSEVAEKTGCKLNYDTSVVEIANPKAKVLYKMKLMKIATEADIIVSVPKLKTHAMMTYTGAVKNNFGTIAGLAKSECHFMMKEADNFAKLLVDLCEYIKPAITVMDAIEGMEGDGPAGGEKCQVGLILVSCNPYALDVAAAHIVGIAPLSVPTIREARERQLHSGLIEDVITQGEDLNSLSVKAFKLPRTVSVSTLGDSLPDNVKKYLVRKIRATPSILQKKCIACKACVQACPAGVIEMVNGKPVIRTEACICCYCCHELCPQNAIQIKKSLIHKIFIG